MSILPLKKAASFLLIISLTQSVLSAASVSNRGASDVEIGYLPRSGGQQQTNPPAMGWLDEPDAESWIIEVARGQDFSSPLITVKDWPWLLYTHTEPLAPGDYSWRYRFADKEGELSTWSQTRGFSVATTATKFPRPSAAMLRQAMPDEHPRMFTTPAKLPALRATAETSTPELLSLVKSANAYLDAKLMEEPKPWTGGKWNVGEWREYLKQASATTAHMDTLAFAWLLTGRADYGARAKEQLMNFASWDPKGPSNMRINDEVGMPVLHSVSRTYDWLYPLLTEIEKRQIIKVMRVRGEEAYDRLRKKPYEQFVHNSHFGRMWHFLGEAGVAFYGEIPEAEKWLNYAMTIFYGWYPYWGDADGGWAEGMWYWSSYNTRITWWLDLMRETLGINGAIKPFFANVGDFPLYVCPPGHPLAGFGDFSERPPPQSSLGRTIGAFALLRQNSAWQWHAEEVGAANGSGVFGYLRSAMKQPEPKAPVDVPLLKVFQKSGFAMFHSDLTNAENNLHVGMRCSMFGNVSHSHNDQNAIIMSAFGEPLLVNTGIRDYYGSPFCKQYYWQTLSHNGLLIDGQGQQRGQETTGTFVAKGGDGERVAWVVGDATNAYGDLAKLYRRWLIYLPDMGAVMVDEIDTTASEVSLLFHGRAPFQVSNNQFSLKKGEVSLKGHLLLPGNPANLKFTQTDEYPLPLGNNMKPLFDEWHLRADVPVSKPDERQYIVTILKASGPDDGAGSDSREWSVETRPGEIQVALKSGRRVIVDLVLDLEKLNVVRRK